MRVEFVYCTSVALARGHYIWRRLIEQLMTMAQPEKFDSEKESWSIFVDRVKLYFEATGVADNEANRAKRRAALLLAMGTENYTRLRHTTPDDEYNGLTFDEIASRMQSYLEPIPLKQAERHKFQCRRQLPNESIATYVPELKKISPALPIRR